MQECQWNRYLRSASETSGIERTLLNFYISVVNSEFAKEKPKHSRFKDFETRGTKLSNFNPFKSTCGGLSV